MLRKKVGQMKAGIQEWLKKKINRKLVDYIKTLKATDGGKELRWFCIYFRMYEHGLVTWNIPRLPGR